MANRPVPVALAVLVFVVTRIATGLVVTVGDGVEHYRHYSDLLAGGSWRELYRSQTERVEYPPLSLAVMRAGGVIADTLPASGPSLLRFRPTPPATVADARYQVAFGLLMTALFDIGLFVAVAAVARRMGPAEAIGERLAIYAVGGALFSPILYDRLDLYVGAFALAAIAAVAKGRPTFAFVALAIGTAFKLVPVLLLPVACFAAAVMAAGATGWGWPLLRRTFRFAVVAGLILSVYPLLSFVLLGPTSFDFLTYHSTRGLEVESVYAWAVLLIEPSTRILDDFHSHTLHGPLATNVARFVPVDSVVALLVAYGFAARAMFRVKERTDWLPTLASSCVLVWLAFVLTNKVGSPQYGLWFLPLVPLLPRQGRVATAFFAMSLMFTVVYPGLYHHVTGGAIGGEPLEFAGPTRLGFALLILRSLSLVAMTAIVARILWIGPRPSGTVA